MLPRKSVRRVFELASRVATERTVEKRLCCPMPCTATMTSVKTGFGRGAAFATVEALAVTFSLSITTVESGITPFIRTKTIRSFKNRELFLERIARFLRTCYQGRYWHLSR